MTPTQSPESSSTEALSRDLALRIAVAARTLPGGDVRALVGALLDAGGGPLTPASFSACSVKSLKQALAGREVEASRKQVEACLAQLRGAAETPAPGPTPPPYVADEWGGSVRVAVASNGGSLADGHFGSCLRFLVYQVAPGRQQLVEVRETLTLPSGGGVDRNDHRIELLADCDIVASVSVGGPAAARIVKRGIFPLKVTTTGSADDVVGGIATVLEGNPPPWLRRIMQGGARPAEDPSDEE